MLGIAKVDPLVGSALGAKVEGAAAAAVPGERVDVAGGIVAGVDDVDWLEVLGAPYLWVSCCLMGLSGTS